MVKHIAKRIVAIATAIGCSLTNIMAYGEAGTFNPIYSGRFSCTQNSYMDISEDDAVMHSVYYPVSAQTTRFLAASNADSLIFDYTQFQATYNHKCDITYSDGTFVKKIDGPIIIEASDVQVNKLSFWGDPKAMTIVYNGRDYYCG